MGRVLFSGGWRPIADAQELLDLVNRSYTRDGDGKFSSTGGMSGDQFDSRAAGAAHDEDVQAMTAMDSDDPVVTGALREYAAGSHEANGQLRTLAGDATKIRDEETRDLVTGMDKAFVGHALDRDVVVMRGVADPTVTFGGREPVAGMEWVDHGYVSTSASQNASDMFTGAKYGIRGGLAMRILAPKGTAAISNHRLRYDSEVVLGRGLKFRLVRDNGVDFDGVRHFDVEVLTR